MKILLWELWWANTMKNRWWTWIPSYYGFAERQFIDPSNSTTSVSYSIFQGSNVPNWHILPCSDISSNGCPMSVLSCNYSKRPRWPFYRVKRFGLTQGESSPKGQQEGGPVRVLPTAVLLQWLVVCEWKSRGIRGRAGSRRSILFLPASQGRCSGLLFW